jgi:large subunit ribosomal protein L13
MEKVINAKNKKLGRLASEIAVILQGKTSARYDPKNSGSDTVIVENVKDIVVTGRKASQKIYYRHTGPLGHLKEKKFKDVFEKNPAWVLRKAVFRMLPKNRLRVKRMKRLIIK